MKKESIFDFPDRILNLYANYYWEYALLHDFRRNLKKSYSAPLQAETGPSQSVGIAPIIVLGMHRSGTTITSKLLRNSGIFMGSIRGKNTDESLFFQNINKAIYSVAHSYWDTPETLQEALQDVTFRENVVNTIRTYCNTQESRSFRGLTNNKGQTLFTMEHPWGWKDPRTCYTLPLWMDLFPGAKVLYVYRNGTDVAQSLHLRNERLMWGKPSSVRCLSLKGAFKIWEMYNEECLTSISQIPEKQVHQVRYEDLLIEPKSTLSGMYRFVGNDVSTSELDKISSKIQRSRAYAFKEENSLINFHEEVRETAMMVKLGYGSISSRTYE